MDQAIKSVIVADDQPLFRSGIKHFLEHNFHCSHILEVENFADLLRALKADSGAKLVTVSLDLAGMAGAKGVIQIRNEFPAVRIVVVSATTDRKDVLDVLAAGAHGFVMKTMPGPQMLAAFQTVFDGQVYVPSMLADRDASDGHGSPAQPASKTLHGMTARQCQVLELMADGKSNKEIARHLGIAEATVKVHLNTVFQLLKVHNRVSAVAALRVLEKGGSLTEPTIPGLLKTDRRRLDAIMLAMVSVGSIIPREMFGLG